MRAITVSVNYSDLLRITAKYNRHHFDEFWIVTSSADEKNVRPVAEEVGARVVVTDLFYDRGAVFNKWAALEFGLAAMKKEGFLCLLDADILIPKNATFHLEKGKLFGARRYLMNDVTVPIPDEEDWNRLPMHPNVGEWPGYLQVFHAEDPVLPNGPWFDTNWLTAGAEDSFFQFRWKRQDKVRHDWHCLHLGPAGVNWAGRVSAYTDGTFPAESTSRLRYLRTMLASRGANGDPARFKNERLPGHGVLGQ